MTFWNLYALELEAFRPGILSKAEFGENLVMVCMEIEAKKEDPGHKHNFDQCGMVLEGQIEMVSEKTANYSSPMSPISYPPG